MKFVADEHIPPAFVTALRSEGYDVTAVGGAVDLGSEDETILGYARTENRVVLSADSDVRGRQTGLAGSQNTRVLATALLPTSI